MLTARENDYQFTVSDELNKKIDALNLTRQLLVEARLEATYAGMELLKGNQEHFKQKYQMSVDLLQKSEAAFQHFLDLPNPIRRDSSQTLKLQELTDKTAAQLKDLFAMLHKQFDYMKAGDTDGYMSIVPLPLQETFMANSDEILTFIGNSLTHYDKLSEASYKHSIIQFIVVNILLLLLLIFAIWWIRVSIKQPLHTLVEHLQHIASGDLTKQHSFYGTNEIGVIFSYFDKMQHYLVSTVKLVRDTSNVIVKDVEVMSKRNDDLSARTEQQAASIEETAASMEELTSTVKQNADNAKSATELAKQSSLTASKGGEITNTVVLTMREISESSQKIGAITNVIDGIAFQTNILALNAAVEAARAGEQGRGFAVVAGEVRNLAQRSAQAAKEIKTLIDESISRVNTGSELVESAGHTIQDIMASVSRVNEIVDEISHASDEQSHGIELASQAVNQMDAVTQQNGMLVRELATAAQDLDTQVGLLTKAVAAFKVDEDSHHSFALHDELHPH